MKTHGKIMKYVENLWNRKCRTKYIISPKKTNDREQKYRNCKAFSFPGHTWQMYMFFLYIILSAAALLGGKKE